MATKAKSNKNIIIGVCAAIVIVILIILAIVFGARNGGIGGLNDAFFTSDGSKYVLTMDADQMAFDDEEHAPVKAHLVYFYSGDEITGLKAYYEYADEESAKAAYDYFAAEIQDEYKSITREGKYVVLEANESEYEGVTPSDVQQQIEFMEMLKNMDLGDDTSDVEVIEETTSDGETEIIDVEETVEE